MVSRVNDDDAPAFDAYLGVAGLPGTEAVSASQALDTVYFATVCTASRPLVQTVLLGGCWAHKVSSQNRFID